MFNVLKLKVPNRAFTSHLNRWNLTVGEMAGAHAVTPHVELLTVSLMATSPKRLLTHGLLSFDKVHAVKIGAFKFLTTAVHSGP